MQVGGLDQRRAEAPIPLMDLPHGGRLPSRQYLGEMPRPSPRGVGEASFRQPIGGPVRRRCERAAEHIRVSTGMDHYKRSKERSAVNGTPWLRLLLWVFASTALVVSLIIRAEDLDERDPGLVVRAGATTPSSETSLPLFSSTIQGGGAARSLGNRPKS